jgi:hypothetical protein
VRNNYNDRQRWQELSKTVVQYLSENYTETLNDVGNVYSRLMYSRSSSQVVAILAIITDNRRLKRESFYDYCMDNSKS